MLPRAAAQKPTAVPLPSSRGACANPLLCQSVSQLRPGRCALPPQKLQALACTAGRLPALRGGCQHLMASCCSHQCLSCCGCSHFWTASKAVHPPACRGACRRFWQGGMRRRTRLCSLCRALPGAMAGLPQAPTHQAAHAGASGQAARADVAAPGSSPAARGELQHPGRPVCGH